MQFILKQNYGLQSASFKALTNKIDSSCKPCVTGNSQVPWWRCSGFQEYLKEIVSSSV